MQTMFHYNWQVREDWYRWCEEISPEDLLRDRIGGAGGILRTLFHIIDVEWSWIRSLQGKPDFQENFEAYNTLEMIRKLDAEFQKEVRPFVLNWEEKLEIKIFTDIRQDGSTASYTWGEVMRHVIAHEIHHIGQLSVWAREIGKKPVSANLIGRGLSIS
ncbi:MULTISPECIES: DinB family protein [unclassified Paenibacillus]|uniref:DinB family protein n=1 Tax=unclassified Paenibacillus TaxID=185978 RepID=UPI00278805A4|nr:MULTISPECIES: DinB family protein [unclassified Paenibacillus]MDQ0900851.1 putative damage-inducible protein DinB [Paenibacillus sp. V4I7]MDQ0920640.1 putative damage-inducible protein DinB [Paenibacillus sp. V4I5]